MRRLSLCTIGIALILTAAGCALPEWGASLPARRPLGADYPTYIPSGSSAQARASADAAAAQEMEPIGELSLREALRRALLRSPDLASFAWSVRQAEAEQLQASLLPNPELEAEFENFGGTGEFRGTRALETTVALSQLVELGGKRAKRMQLARLDSKLAGWDYEAKRLEVLTDVTQKYFTLLAAQKHLELARENQKLAEEAVETVEKSVNAGKSAPPEKLKASVEAATSRIETREAERDLAVARRQLAATWGSRQVRFDQAVGDVTTLVPPPGLDALEPHLAASPELARWETEAAQRQSALDLAKADAIPDVTVGLGFKQSPDVEGGDRAALVTASIPLPLFNRNQGEISKARFGVMKVNADREAARVRLHAQLAEAYEQLASAYEESRALQEEVLPTARRAYEAAERSFKEGKSGYLELLDAQRTLVETQSKHVEVLTAYHQARAAVEAMVGKSLDTMTATSQTDEGDPNEK